MCRKENKMSNNAGREISEKERLLAMALNFGAIRKLANWGFAQLAEATGIPKKRLRAIENGSLPSKLEYLGLRAVIDKKVISCDEDDIFPYMVILLLDTPQGDDSEGDSADPGRVYLDIITAALSTTDRVTEKFKNSIKQAMGTLNLSNQVGTTQHFGWADDVEERPGEAKSTDKPNNKDAISACLMNLNLPIDVAATAEYLEHCSEQTITNKQNALVLKHLFEDCTDYMQYKATPAGADRVLGELKEAIESQYRFLRDEYPSKPLIQLMDPPENRGIYSLAILFGSIYHEYLIKIKGYPNYFTGKYKTLVNKYHGIYNK